MVEEVQGLPYPTTVSAPRRKLSSFSVPKFSSSIHGYSNHNRRMTSTSNGSFFFNLKSRSRITNLSILLLLSFLCSSLLFNFKLFFFNRSNNFRSSLNTPNSITLTLPLTNTHSKLKHLVIVPGHAVWIGHDSSLATNDEEWILEPRQKGGNVKTFIEHIKKGIEIALEDKESLLIYSGGQTRLHSDMTEATSYARLAKASGFYGDAPEVDFERVTTEDYALDSLQNVLFSIARFKEFTGHFPTQITVVGFGMKRKRYENVHRESLRIPSSNFNYIGIDNVGNTEDDYEGERLNGLAPFLRDFYGCHGVLLSKRLKRNPFRRYHPYHSSAPELYSLLEFCPDKNEIFDGVLPWDEQGAGKI